MEESLKFSQLISLLIRNKKVFVATLLIGFPVLLWFLSFRARAPEISAVIELGRSVRNNRIELVAKAVPYADKIRKAIIPSVAQKNPQYLKYADRVKISSSRDGDTISISGTFEKKSEVEDFFNTLLSEIIANLGRLENHEIGIRKFRSSSMLDTITSVQNQLYRINTTGNTMINKDLDDLEIIANAAKGKIRKLPSANGRNLDAIIASQFAATELHLAKQKISIDLPIAQATMQVDIAKLQFELAEDKFISENYLKTRTLLLPTWKHIDGINKTIGTILSLVIAIFIAGAAAISFSLLKDAFQDALKAE